MCVSYLLTYVGDEASGTEEGWNGRLYRLRVRQLLFQSFDAPTKVEASDRTQVNVMLNS